MQEQNERVRFALVIVLGNEKVVLERFPCFEVFVLELLEVIDD